jgi:Lon protease-like protein
MFDTVSVDFRRPFAVFPLPETILLPHGIAPLHIFEPRYTQMVSEAMDSRGQIAMATWADLSPDSAEPRPILPIVCLGQIVQYERVQSGYEMLLHGLCRARVEAMIEPGGDRMYRMATLRPLKAGKRNAAQLQHARGELHAMLRRKSLRPLERLETVANWFDMADVPTGPLVDLAGSAVLGQPQQRYQLLAEPDPCKRAGMVLKELQDLERLLRLAALQPPELDGRICVN